MIELGSRVKDRITGLRGILIARTDWLYQCRRVAIQPEGLHDGKPAEVVWVDEPQVQVLKAGVIQPPVTQVLRTGGPVRSAPSRRDPQR